MIEGAVTDEGVPTITIDLAGRRWTAVIDTGFNGDLELPVELKDVLPLRYLGRVTSTLAAGQVVSEEVYQIELPFDGKLVTASATFAPVVEVLLGTRLIQSHRLEIDFPAQTVLLQRS